MSPQDNGPLPEETSPQTEASGDSSNGADGHRAEFTASESPVNKANASVPGNQDQGPGCLPGCLAATVLGLMFGFIVCGVSTWYLYQQRTVLAVRTLQGFVIPEIEQSGMEQSEKGEVITILREVVTQAEEGQLEDWQASGIMERLKRSPLMQWGDLAVADALINTSPEFTEVEKTDASMQLARLRRAAELGEAIDADFVDVLSPIMDESDGTSAPRIRRDATAQQMRDVVLRAKLIADRGKIPNEMFDVRIADILAREVREGKQSGGL